MKKGYTLIEITIVLAILSILLAVSFINTGGIYSRTQVESFTNQTSALIKEAYETSSNEMDYSSYKIEVDNHYTGDTLVIRLEKGNTVLKEISSKKISLNQVETSNFSDGIYYIIFQQTGDVNVYKNNLSTLVGTYPEFNIKVLMDSSPPYTRTITISSIPPGSLAVN